MTAAIAHVAGHARGAILATSEPLSFWGGVDPATGLVIDTHHPLVGRSISGAILMMPSSRGSCSGSGVLLDLILNDRAPAALLFSQAEDVLTLGALIAAEMFDRPIPVLRLDQTTFDAVAARPDAVIEAGYLRAGGLDIALSDVPRSGLDLTDDEEAMLGGGAGPAAALAMRVIAAVARQQRAERLIPVAQAHIDGCIYASPANLTFAETMYAMGARVAVPTTMNAISVDHDNWRGQGVPADFGAPAQRLADAYVAMGCRPTFTCAPYLLESRPSHGEAIAWAESNAVIYANSVLGARTPKHPDFLDLCIAITGRAPLSGVYLDTARRPQVAIEIEAPDPCPAAFWPLAGYLAGSLAATRIPLLTGLAATAPDTDDLKALCAAFGTTAAAPMLHVAGITPEAPADPGDLALMHITRAELRTAWQHLNDGPVEVDLVAIGSPHASVTECRALAAALGSRRAVVSLIVTAGRDVIATLAADGTLARLEASGVKIIPDLCWCSISEPVFPPATRTVLTNSGKYAHYGPGLSGRRVRFGELADCVEAACTGHVAPRVPDWLAG